MVLAKIEIAVDTYLVGIGVSPGISIGELNLLNQSTTVDDLPISAGEVDNELERFQWALGQARDQLQEIKQTVSQKKHLREHLYILDTHLLILGDEMLVQGTEQEIRNLNSSEGALKKLSAISVSCLKISKMSTCANGIPMLMRSVVG